MKSHTDLANYRAMSEPFASEAEAEAALNLFLDDVEAARKEHRIADVHLLIQVGAISKHGDEGLLKMQAHFGNSQESEQMCAWGLGQATAKRNEVVRELLAHTL